jgi:signal transduction histidine kinase
VKLRLKERSLLAALVVPAAIVVIVLAFLQYKWSNQVSEATSVRLADSLQMSMINWHLELFRDLSQICLTLGVDPEGEPLSDLRQFAGSFAEWRATAQYPDIVSNLYVLTPDGPAHSDTLRFNPATGGFESDSWPTNLLAFREKLSQIVAVSVGAGDMAGKFNKPSLQTQDQQFIEGIYPRGPLIGWRFEPSIPALLHPIFGKRDRRESVHWVVVELNNNELRERILPELVQRYFQGTDGLDFQVAVVGGNPRSVIYSSDPGFGQNQVVDADGTMDLFGRVQDKIVGSPVHVFHKPSENTGLSAAVGVSWFPLLSDAPEEQDWQLVVRHRRGGPMGAFAAELRRRDLTISFGVLLLLVLSMAMLIIASHRAQRLAKLQMNFVMTVSHELRTPLTVISSAADNISHGVVQGGQQLAQYGAVIGAQARQLSGLVERVLLFAATRERRQRYNPRLLAVSQIIDATLASTVGQIQAAGFTVEQEIEPNLPCVEGDLAALSQCLQNLITNALKYGGQQRWIGVSARLNEHGPDGREIEIGISDRGIGIGSEDLPRIFEPFYRGTSPATAHIHGTGLGLPLAKSIAEAMRGRLAVVSVPGRGSTFSLHLPCADLSLERSETQPSRAVSAD